LNTPGKCRWCGCTYDEPCPESCGWANREQTLCTACVAVDREWRRLSRPQPNMRRAFFRGFMVGSDDERAERTAKGHLSGNPYASSGASALWWERGRVAGEKET
jgi:hypothetical protein